MSQTETSAVIRHSVAVIAVIAVGAAAYALGDILTPLALAVFLSIMIDGFVRVQNNSGEDYENAEVRLVVGTINLVEKIAQLARISTGTFRSTRRNTMPVSTAAGRKVM